MEFFSSAVDVIKTLCTAIGAGVGLWGIINLLEGYGSDNPGAKSQGIKQLMAGGGIILLAQVLVPELSKVFAMVEPTVPKQAVIYAIECVKDAARKLAA